MTSTMRHAHNNGPRSSFDEIDAYLSTAAVVLEVDEVEHHDLDPFGDEIDVEMSDLS